MFTFCLFICCWFYGENESRIVDDDGFLVSDDELLGDRDIIEQYKDIESEDTDIVEVSLEVGIGLSVDTVTSVIKNVINGQASIFKI